MIVLQVRPISESIRFRTAEWGCAGVMVAWGAVLLFPDPSFSNPSWSVLARWASETTWGAVFFLIGLARIAVLTRNGRWHYFHAARKALAWVSCLLWATLLLSLIVVNTGYMNTGIAVYLGYLALDYGSIYISTYDAQRQKEALRDGAA